MKRRLILQALFLLFSFSIIIAQTLNGPFAPDRGLEEFEKATGRPVYFPSPPENWYEKGQCTWFVRAVRNDQPFPVPKGQGNAFQWFSHFQKAGYAVGAMPKVGSIVVWNQNVALGYGHVALVTKVESEDVFEVWDCNFSPVMDRKVRQRRVASQTNLTGFIYWPNGQDEEALKVLQVYPQDGSVNISPKIEPTIVFNQPIDSSTLNEAISLTPAGTIGKYLPFEIPYKGPAKLVLEEPNKVKYTDFYFYPGTTFTVKISQRLKSQGGASLSEPFEFNFTIGLDRILFCLEDENGQTALWTINPDSSGLKKWMNWDKDLGAPSFSRDGQKMAYYQNMGNKRYAIYLTDLGSRKSEQFLSISGPSPSFLEWFPDSHKITVCYSEERGGYLWTMYKLIDIETLRFRDMTETEGLFIRGWSPDGKQIACVDSTDLFIGQADGTNLRNVTSNFPQTINELRHSWSPDGKWLALLSSARCDGLPMPTKVESWYDLWYDLYLIRPTGRNRRMIVGDLKYLKDIDWSKDGEKLVVVVGPPDGVLTDQKGEYKLMVINLADPSQRQIIFQKGNCKIHSVFWNSFRTNF